MDVHEIIEKWRGKGKVNIFGIERGDSGVYLVRFKEGRNPMTFVEFPKREQAEEFAFEFGGKNNLTISTHKELLNLSGWDHEKITNNGHSVISLSLGIGRQKEDAERIIQYILPLSCGHPSINIKGGSDSTKPVTVEEIIGSVNKTRTKKIDFADSYQVDCLRDWFAEKIPNMEIPIKKAVTRCDDYGILCSWVRRKVGDGSKRMELRLEALDGIHYFSCHYGKILEAGDNMAAGECERVFGRHKIEADFEKCGIKFSNIPNAVI